MFEPFERDVERDVEQSMELFERAQVGEVAAIEPRQPTRVLLVVDGSSQDPLSLNFARYFREQFQAELSVLDARETATTDELAQRTGGALTARVLSKRSGNSFDQILEAIAESQCDLVVVPCPFGRDLETVGPDSAGTVIDVLLSRSSVPLLVIREPYTGAVFDRVLLALIGENEAARHAAEWAVGLAGAGVRLRLTLVLETEFYENVRQVLAAIEPERRLDPETLSQAMLHANVRLHRALQKAADARGIGYELKVLQQTDPTFDSPEMAAAHPLVVLPLERGDYASEGYVHDRIRRSRHALLIVPSADRGSAPPRE